METGVPLKRASAIRSPPLAAGRSFFQRPRSRLARFLLFEKVDYLHWICTVAAFFFVVILFQAFLPGSISEKLPNRRSFDVDRGVLKSSFRELEFGDGIRFVPAKLLERFEREKKEVDSFLVASGRPIRRAGLRKPRLALVSCVLIEVFFVLSFLWSSIDLIWQIWEFWLAGSWWTVAGCYAAADG